MNSYSKLKLVKTTNKSNSIDFSDLQPFPDEHTKSTKPQLTIFKTQKPKQETNTQDFICSPPTLEHNDEPANPYDNKSRTTTFIRNSSVSGATTGSSGRFELKKPSTSALENAVKKAFSMRSSSVSERYCRIHHQCVTLASPFNGDDTDDDEKVGDDANKKMQTRSMEMMKKKKYQKYSSGRISKACKRLSNFLGLH